MSARGAEWFLEGALLWEAIEDDLRKHNRYAPEANGVAQGLVQHCLKLRRDRVEGGELFRARIMPLGHRRTDGPYPLDSSEVGAPPSAKATGGRLNPPGISYLYLATSGEAAIDEVRAWPEALITVTTFRLTRPCSLVSLADLDSYHLDPLVGWFSNVLATPADRRDPLTYVASQFISEHLKAGGADGVEYGSSFNRVRERNVALFDLEAATPVATRLYQVDAVNVSSHEILPPGAPRRGGPNPIGRLLARIESAERPSLPEPDPTDETSSR